MPSSKNDNSDTNGISRSFIPLQEEVEKEYNHPNSDNETTTAAIAVENDDTTKQIIDQDNNLLLSTETTTKPNKNNEQQEVFLPASSSVSRGTSVLNGLGLNDDDDNDTTDMSESQQVSDKKVVVVADGGRNIQKTISFSEEVEQHDDDTSSSDMLAEQQQQQITTTMNRSQKTTSSTTECCQKEPEGLRGSREVSRRFDDAMLKEVMEEEKRERESSSSSSVDCPVIHEREEIISPYDHNDDDDSVDHDDEPAQQQQDSNKNDMSTNNENPNESFASNGSKSGREPPGTPAVSHKGTTKVSEEEDGETKMKLPILPGTDSEESDYEHDSSPPEGTQASESSTTRSEDTPQESVRDSTSPEKGYVENNHEPSLDMAITSRPQSFTTHLSHYGASVHAPVAAPLSSHVEIESIARSSFIQPTSNGLHANRIVYPNGEMGIPNLPPLALPPGAPLHSNGYHHTIPSALAPAPSHSVMPGGKRRIHLRLEEDVSKPERSSFLSFRRRGRNPSHSPINEIEPSHNPNHWVDRGTLTVSWYEGTSSLELQEHVRNSVTRKLQLKGTTKLADFRVLDDSMNPPEEIVLCPYIPNGSRLLLRFSTKDAGGDATPQYPRLSEFSSGPPESPSAAPSPHPTGLDLGGLGLNANQLALLGARLRALQIPSPDQTESSSSRVKIVDGNKPLPKLPNFKPDVNSSGDKDSSGKGSSDDEDDNSKGSNTEIASLHPEDQIQRSLREITELLIAERSGKRYVPPRQEKRQVIFVLANYFVLFLSLIAISAEIQARAPGWHASMEAHLKNVQNCSKDKESLFECVENGDFAGLIASVVLWISRSAATKRIFLFGFESPKKLWTVVYESLVTAVCWGFSYMFIRRGMNPDTNRNFLQKYWKDAVYGSLAGFNAAFMKHVLKNLIPQEAIEDALQDRQLKILSWLPSFS